MVRASITLALRAIDPFHFLLAIATFPKKEKRKKEEQC
jgi:hypothetical protein